MRYHRGDRRDHRRPDPVACTTCPLVRTQLPDGRWHFVCERNPSVEHTGDRPNLIRVCIDSDCHRAASRRPRRLLRWLKRRLPRPGDVLARLIDRAYGLELGADTGPCGCTKRRNRMNAWGWLNCWKHRHQIWHWLVEQSAARGLTLRRRDLPRWLLRAALRRSADKSPHRQS